MTPLARASVLAALPLACGQPAAGTTQDTDVTTSAATDALASTSVAPVSTGPPTTTVPTTGASADTDSTTFVPISTSGSSAADASTSLFTTTGETGDDSTTEAVSGGSSSSGGAESSSGGDTGCELGCSPEFDQVLCDGAVIETCRADRYCVDGGCHALGPCEAAALLQRSEGCDFWAVKTELYAEAKGACFAVFVANTVRPKPPERPRTRRSAAIPGKRAFRRGWARSEAARRGPERTGFWQRFGNALATRDVREARTDARASGREAGECRALRGT